jgi:pyruvate,water dikinase
VGTVAAVCDQLGELGSVMTLVAGIGDVDSAAPANAMWELSRLDPDSEEFRAGFAKFQDEFGSRGPNEWELRSPTWGTEPAIALAAIDCMRPAPDLVSPASHLTSREAEADREDARVEALLTGNDEALAQFRAGVRAARLYLAGRERTKTTIIKVVNDMRLAALELGRRHCERPELVFMVKEAELDEFVAYPDAFRDLTLEREREYLQLFALEPPFIVVEAVPPLREWRRRGEHSLQPATRGDQLAGIPGCPGTATGRARVVLDPTDPSGLEPGDVLVAPITDPAWTPLFVPAAAVVVDVGAQVSHAVIVSRELGIPCVVSVTDATRRIPDGAPVEVDGTAGTVTLL